AQDTSTAAAQCMSVQPETAAIIIEERAQAALASGDLAAARRWADEAVSETAAWPYHAMEALTTRARVAIAHSEPEQADRDAHDALPRAARVEANLGIPDILECLARLAADASSHREAARLFGAAAAMRERMGVVRFKIYDSDYEASTAALRSAMDDNDF